MTRPVPGRIRGCQWRPGREMGAHPASGMQNASNPPAKQGMKASDIRECFRSGIQARTGWPHPSLCGEAVSNPVGFVPTVPTEIRPRWDSPKGTIDPGTGSKPDEHHWRDILTTGFEPRPRLPRLASSGCRVRPGGLLPDTVAQPSPILTAFPHFQRCFDLGFFEKEQARQRTGR